jgi:phosphatidylglycerophosphate synthase
MKKGKQENNHFSYKKSLKKNDDSFINKAIRVERYINRPIASLLVRGLIKTPITPNGVTFISFFCGLAGAFFLSRGEYIYFILGGVFVQLSSILDCADGMLARSKDMCTDFGSYLDLFLDRIVDFLIIIGISLGLYGAYSDYSLLFFGFLTAGLYLLQINLFYIIKAYKKSEQTGETGEARALFLFLIFIFSLINYPNILIYLMLVTTSTIIIAKVIHFIRLGREVKT